MYEEDGMIFLNCCIKQKVVAINVSHKPPAQTLMILTAKKNPGKASLWRDIPSHFRHTTTVNTSESRAKIRDPTVNTSKSRSKIRMRQRSQCRRQRTHVWRMFSGITTKRALRQKKARPKELRPNDGYEAQRRRYIKKMRRILSEATKNTGQVESLK
jgi:hypothetical protein